MYLFIYHGGNGGGRKENNVEGGDWGGGEGVVDEREAWIWMLLSIEEMFDLFEVKAKKILPISFLLLSS